eukprot:g15576.t1
MTGAQTAGDDDVVIVAARRGAIGKFNGSLRQFSAPQMGAVVLKKCLEDIGNPTSAIDEVIVGQVLTAGGGQNTARQTSIMAGLPETTPSYTINKVCGSGLKVVQLGMMAIKSGEAENLIACGGQESMSNAPHFLAGKTSRLGQKMGDMKLADTMLTDGLTCAFNKYHMGITAENVAQKYKLTRQEQDQFAADSQKKALANVAHNEKHLVPIGKLAKDEYVNPKGGEVEGLAKLKPAFLKQNGTVTAGNASGLNDGAAFVILCSRREAAKRKLPILMVIKAFASAGLDPKVMGLGPIPATKKCLEKAKWTVGDLDVIESNEAFASQSLAVAKELGLPADRINPNGGAIALGHPIGASGTRILVDLIHEMRRTNKKRGLATMCIGGGQGVAIAIENPGATPQAKL